MDQEALQAIEGLKVYFDYIEECADNTKEENSDEDISGSNKGADSDDYQAKIPSRRISKTPWVVAISYE